VIQGRKKGCWGLATGLQGRFLQGRQSVSQHAAEIYEFGVTKNNWHFAITEIF